MSYQTEADQKLETVKENINLAIENLSEIVINRCPGENEYNQTFRLKMRESLNNLLEMRDDLKG